MLTALVLVCSLAVTPDLADCNRTNAVDVIRVAEESGNPYMCFKYGQVYLAQTGIGRTLAANERIKLVCVQSKSVNMG
jgi:hypothetical protein